MTEEPVTLFLPCDAVRVRAIVDFGPSVSPIEETVLQALAVQPMPVEELATLLALPQRVVVDVVHALWRLGRLSFEPGRGALKVSEEVVRASGAGLLTALNGAEREERVLELIIDQALGQVLPPESWPYAPRPARVDPFRNGITLAEIPIADVQRAATEALRMRLAPDPGGGQATARDRRILDLRPVPSFAKPRRWRPVLVRPWLDERSGTLGVTIVDPRMPLAIRELGSARLTQLVADSPGAPFAELLRAHAAAHTPRTLTAESLAKALTKHARRLTDVPAEQRILHHGQLTEAAALLAEALEMRIDGEVHADLVVGEALTRVAGELIDAAHTQLVIVMARLGKAELPLIRTRLRDARIRGVQVVLLLEDAAEARNALLELSQAPGPAPLVLPSQPTRTHAGLIIQDDVAALILTDTVLPDGDGDGLGVLLREPDGGICPAVRSTLPWVRSVTPQFASSRTILLRPSADGPHAAQLEAARLDRIPEEPPVDTADAGRAAVVAWEAAWRAYAAGQWEFLRTRPLPQARWVMGIANHSLLWNALWTARRRLVIASTRISDRMVDGRFLALLRSRLAQGVAVTLAYRPAHKHGSAALTALDALAAQFPESLFLVQSTAETRALVWDDDAVLGATDHLAGDLKAADGPTTRRSLLALRLSGAAIADRVASALGEPPPITARVSRADRPGPGPSDLSAQIKVLNTVQRIRNRLCAGHSIEQALDVLAAAPDPWRVLEALGEDSSDELVRTAAAWCLIHRANASTPEAMNRWRQRLIEHHWRTGRFAEAALLCLSDPLGASPRPPLALAAAAMGTEISGMALLAALEDERRSPAEDSCLLAVAAAETLRTTADDLAEIVEWLLRRTATPWRELGQVVLDYHNQARGIPPVLLLRPAAERAARSQRVAAAWDALARAIDRAQHTQATFADLARTQIALFRRSGPFGRLEPATERRDADAVAAFLQSHAELDEPDDKMVGRLIDGVWGQVALGSPRLDGQARRTLTARLAAILAAARGVVEADQDLARHQASASTPTQLDAVHSLAARVSALLTALNAASGGLGYPESDLARHAVGRISHLIQPEVS